MYVRRKNRQGHAPGKPLFPVYPYLFAPLVIQCVYSGLNTRMPPPRLRKPLIALPLPVPLPELPLLRQTVPLQYPVKPLPVLRTPEPLIETA